MSKIDVTASGAPITVSASGSGVNVDVGQPSTVNVDISGGQGPQGPAGAQGEPGEGASLPAGTEGYVLTYVDGEWVAAETASSADALPLAGGAMDANAIVTFSNGTTDSEIGGWGFGVQVTGNASQYAYVEPQAVVVNSAAGSVTLGTTGLTLPNATQLVVGSFDNMTGGANGISLICAVGYELNWQGGRLRNVQLAGDGTPQTIFCDSPIEFTGEDGNVTITGDGIIFPDGTQTVAWPGSLSYDDLDDLPTLFDGAYSSLTGLPTLGTAAAAATADFAAASHNQAWSTITSTPTSLSGYGITDAASSSHTHTQLHDRSHAITSSSDHTATAWRVWYSNASGAVTELALGANGTYLRSNGASAAPTWEAVSGSVTYATTAQNRAAPPTATNVAVDPAGLLEAAWSLNRFTNTFFDPTAVSGSSSGTATFVRNFYGATITATSAGVGWSRHNWANTGSINLSAFNGQPDASGNTPIDFSKPQRVSFRLGYSASLASGNAIRVRLYNTSSQSSGGITSTERGVELRITSDQVRLVAANGTAVTDSGVLGNYPSARITGSATTFGHTLFELHLNGTGGCSVYMDGDLLGSVTGVSTASTSAQHGYFQYGYDGSSGTAQNITVHFGWFRYMGFR